MRIIVVMEVGPAAKPISLAIPNSRVVCHITPPDDEPIAASKPVPVPKPKNVYSLQPSRSPSPSRRSSPRTSFLQDAYRALTGARRNSGTMQTTPSAPPPSPSQLSVASADCGVVRYAGTSCLLDVPKDGQFRNRSKSLDDGTRKPPAHAPGSVRLDSGDAYKIFDNILKEGISTFENWSFLHVNKLAHNVLMYIVHSTVLQAVGLAHMIVSPANIIYRPKFRF